MNHQIITGHYTNDKRIRLYLRDENSERHHIDVAGFEPYSAVLEDIPVPNVTEIVRIEQAPPALSGEALKMIFYDTPNSVKPLRENFDRRWEDDVRFVKRLLIDCDITSGIALRNTECVIHYTDLVPVDFSHLPLTCYWDIECYSKDRIPDPQHPDQKITCVTFWDQNNKHYYTLLLDDNKKVTRVSSEWSIYHLTDEKSLAQMALNYLKNLQPDVLAEWGSLDEDYFPPRARIHELNTSIFRTFCTFDMIPAYKNLYHKGSNRLKDVALDEGIIDYVAPEVDFAWLWDNDRMALAKKNKLDVEWIVKLDALKGDLIQFFWNLKNYSGQEDLQETTYHGMHIDTKLLRGYHGKYMMSSRPSKEEEARRGGLRLIGALVKDPPTGLFDHVAVVDFSRYYQNILIGILDQSGEERFKPLRDLAQELQDVRDEYDQRLEMTEIDTPEYKSVKGIRNAVKYIGEALIGYLGGRRSRWYQPDIFEAVIRLGREGLLHAEKFCKDLGYTVYYYDTDGLDVEVKGDTQIELVQDAWDLTAKLNDEMKIWAPEHGIDQPISLKVDMVSNKALYSGKKKRKAMHVIWEDGDYCDYLMVKGFEYIRRDSSLLTREVQKQVFEHLLRKGMDGLKEYLNGVLKTMKAGGYDLRKISLSKGIKKPFKDYKSRPDFIRGSLWANKHLDARIHAGDQVKMIYVKRTPGYPSTNVVCFLDEEIIPKNFVIDYEKMIDRTIRGKVDQYIAQGGLSWATVMGMKNLAGVFG